MLIVNGETVNTKKFCIDEGLNFEKIVNNPTFELHKKFQKKDKANGNAVKIPARFSFPAKIHIKSKNSGDTLEVRYAENKNYRIVGKERVEVYAPRYINIDTAKFSARDNEDKAVFLFINTLNVSSPYGNGKNCDYEHLDPTEIAKTRMASMSNITKVLSTIENMEQTEMVVLAKGLKATFPNFNPFVDGSDTHPDIVKVEMMQFAQLNADTFLEVVDSDIAKTKGQIINLVDNGIIKEFTVQNMRQWKWDKGARNGNPIGDQIVDPHANSLDYLVNYILSNLGTYYTDLYTSNTTVSSESQALNFLKEHKEKQIEVVYDNSSLPQSYAEVRDWMGENGFKKSPELVKKVNEAIQDGTITVGNIKELVAQMQISVVDEKSY